MIKIGITGLGFMGMIHFLAAARLPHARVAALCSRDPRKRAGDWTSIQGNFGPRGTMMDLTGISTYSDYAELLADPNIDLVDVCNPTQSHAEYAVAALQAGKHVLVEKAISLTRSDADRMIETANHAGKKLLVAHVLPFFPEFAYVSRVVHSGECGRLLAGHFTRVISEPDWSQDIADAASTGGPAVDLHIHDTHFIRMLWGMPETLYSQGTVDEKGVVKYLTTQYRFSSGMVLSASSGALAGRGRPFTHGFELYFEKATLAYSSAGLPLTRYDQEGKVEQIDLQASSDPVDSFRDELAEAVSAVSSNEEYQGPLSADFARDALALCFEEIKSVHEQKPLTLS